MSSATSRVYIARLAGTAVFDPIGDLVGRVRDVVMIMPAKGAPRAVGLVVEVPGRRRVFLPLTRVTSIDAGQVISTGLVNMRRFEQRVTETLAIGELLERTVEFVDGSGTAKLLDLAMEKQRSRDWRVTKLFVRRDSHQKNPLGIRKRGETVVVDLDEVTGLAVVGSDQGAALLIATYASLKPADLADALHDLGPARRLEVAGALDDERLADVLEELPEDDQVELLSALERGRAADILEAMQPDDAADLLGDLPDEQAAELLGLMEPEDARDVRRLLAYDDYTAGGLMTTEPVIVGPETAIASALAMVRREDLTPALASLVFVVRPPLETPTGKLLGVVHIQRMLREAPHTPVGAVVDSAVEAVRPEVHLSKVSRLMAAYNILAVPVVDSERRLLGAISIDDVLDHLLPEDWREGSDDADAPAGAGVADG